jgi:hypothetical protein
LFFAYDTESKLKPVLIYAYIIDARDCHLPNNWKREGGVTGSLYIDRQTKCIISHMIEIYGHETEDKLHKQIYGHRSNIIDNVNNIVYQHYINLIIRSFQWEYTSTKQYFILSTFYCQANTDNGSHTSYQLLTLAICQWTFDFIQ